uniref:Cadherin domain-containing protein n=1 Tax=Anopheles minimus TaxID=112268 RepID=A0A182W2N1_9DIPT
MPSPSTPVGTTIFRSIQATDKDAGVNGLVEYFIVEGSQNISDISPNTLTAADGFGVFAIAYPHQGQCRTTVPPALSTAIAGDAVPSTGRLLWISSTGSKNRVTGEHGPCETKR